MTNDAAAYLAYSKTRVICPKGNFMTKNSVNQCKTLSRSQKTLYKCRESSTNPPFFAKRTQFSPILAQKQRFIPKTNPKQTQNKPKQTQYLLKKRYDKQKQTQT